MALGTLLAAPPLPAPLLAFSLLAVFGAGIARGFAGFGFSALSVAALSLVVSPARIVPAMFMLEVLASLSLLRSAWRDVDWRWITWLVAGNVLCVPLGVAVLAFLPEAPLRLLVGTLLLLAALALRAGWALALAPTRRVRLATGVVSGVVNGAAAIGGMAVAVMLSTSQMAPLAMRATLIVLFLFTDLYALAWAAVMPTGADAAAALLGADTLAWAVWMAPAMLLGIVVGARAAVRLPHANFRRHILNLLLVIATATTARALVDVLA